MEEQHLSRPCDAAWVFTKDYLTKPLRPSGARIAPVAGKEVGKERSAADGRGGTSHQHHATSIASNHIA